MCGKMCRRFRVVSSFEVKKKQSLHYTSKGKQRGKGILLNSAARLWLEII